MILDVPSRSQQAETLFSSCFSIWHKCNSLSQHGMVGPIITSASFSITLFMLRALGWRIARHVSIFFHTLTMVHEYFTSQWSFTEHKELTLSYSTGPQPSMQTLVCSHSYCVTCTNNIASKVPISELQASACNSWAWRTCCVWGGEIYWLQSSGFPVIPSRRTCVSWQPQSRPARSYCTNQICKCTQAVL